MLLLRQRLFLLEAAPTDRSDAISRWLAHEAKRLGAAQHVYIAGGAVRDFVMGKIPKDVDIVVDKSGLGGKGSEWFATELAKAIPVRTRVNANKYGAALLSISEPWTIDGHEMKGEVLDIANAAEGRDPNPMMSHVKGFDFTFNTLVWRLADLAKGRDKAKILDLTGCGLSDIKGGVMRCPIDPHETFSQDPSRLLRAVKFLVRYRGKFKVPPAMLQAIRKNAPRIKAISPEKLTNLLTSEILTEKHFDHSVEELKRLGLLDAIAGVLRGSKGLQKTMGNWARAQNVNFALKIKDSGLPITSPIDFLTSRQQSQFRRAVKSMSSGKAQAFLDALKQPGKAIKDKKFMSGLAKGLGANMREFAPKFTVTARETMLDHPALASNPVKLKAAIEAAFRP
jgi:tRNA nucleotidyltransferase/poly(A) polymerase